MSDIIQRLNEIMLYRTIPVQPGIDGRQKIELDWPKARVVGYSLDRIDASVATKIEDGDLFVEVKTMGTHFTPQPWPIDEALDLAISVMIQPEAIDESLSMVPYSIDLPEAPEHIVNHGMGSTKFIESVVSMDGVRQFISVQVIDENQFKVMLAEPMPVQLTAIFLKEPVHADSNS